MVRYHWSVGTKISKVAEVHSIKVYNTFIPNYTCSKIYSTVQWCMLTTATQMNWYMITPVMQMKWHITTSVIQMQIYKTTFGEQMKR